ncbi:MAG: response regulator [Desulfobacterales bacterium]|nr:response regulator [Desulfobacterales bacterium]
MVDNHNKKARILIVEDDAIISARLEGILMKLGYETLGVFMYGEDAVRKIDQVRPDLVLMDIYLAGEMNGVEAAGRIMEKYDVPVLYLTAYSDDELLRRARLTRPHGYLIKPIQDRELYAAIEMALRSHELETRLKTNERWLDATLKSIGDGVIAADKHGVVTFMNPAAEDLTGRRRAEASGKDLTEVFHIVNEESNAPLGDLMAAIIDDAAFGCFPDLTLLVAENGIKTPIDYKATPMRDEKGNIKGVVLVFRDVTESRRSEEKLRLSEERFNKVFHSNPAGMVVSSLADGRCMNVNDSFTRITGYEQEEILGRTFIEVGFWITPGDRDRMTAVLREHGKFRDLEFDFRARSGEIRSGLFSSELIRIEGETYIITAARDITDRKRAEHDLFLEMERRKQVEEQLRVMVEDLERANAELQDFAHIVSHDLKAPLRGVISLANWLEEDYGEALGEEGRKYFDKLQLRARLMNEMIDGILDYARVGRGEADPQRLDSDALVRKLIDNLHPPVGVHVKIEGHLPVVVFDITLLGQVFQNLIVNAIKYMGKPRGKVVISSVKKGNAHEFSVRDNGRGIEEKNFERIFRIFQSLDSDSGKKSTGVGLSLVRKIVERNGGRVRVESRVGVGSAFYFTVPIRRGPEKPTAGLTALLIDDNMEFVSIVKAMLKHEKYKVLSAASGREALTIAQKYDGDIHFALFDVEIPGEDPLKRYDKLRESRPDMKIILCTGFDGSETTRRVAAKGVEGVLKKPFRVNELQEIIRGE